MLPAFRIGFLIPTYNNPVTIARVVENARAHLPDVMVVDDGSSKAGREACSTLATRGMAHVFHLGQNSGKGAAVKLGFAEALKLGWTHVLQIDADGQHDLGAVASFVAAAQRNPAACIVAYPEYDSSAPLARRIARKFTEFWVNLEAGRGVIRDAMIGFRVYPLSSVTALRVVGDRMDFDVEVVIRLAWAGVPIVNLPVKVRYLGADEGGISHFRPLIDNLRFSWLHSKLCTEKSIRWVFGLFKSRRHA